MKINPGNLSLSPISLDEYLPLRKYIYSKCALKFDDLCRPIPSVEKEKEWWKENVKTGQHIVFAVKLDNKEICGLVHIFDIGRTPGSCETGLTIFPESNYNRGIGYHANELVLQYIENELKLEKVTAETNVRNLYAVKLYEKSGFIKTGINREGTIDWQRLEYIF